MRMLLLAATAVFVAFLGTAALANSPLEGAVKALPGGDEGIQAPAGRALIDAWNDTQVPTISWTYAANCFGFAYTPSQSYFLQRIEFFAGDLAGPVTVAVLDDGGTGFPTGNVLGSVAYNESPPRGWQGADLVPPVVLTAGLTYYIRYEVVVNALLSAADAGTIIPHSWSWDNCATWNGPGSSFRWMARFYGDTVVPVEATTWGGVKALYR